MSIIRTRKKRNPYVQIDKTPIEDTRLSYKARGIMTYLMTKPDNWIVQVSDLVNKSDKDGREAVQSGVKELEEAGYILRQKTKDPETGRFTGWETVLFETPEDRIEYERSQEIEPTNGKADVGETVNRGNRKSENTCVGETVNRKTPPLVINEFKSINEKEVNNQSSNDHNSCGQRLSGSDRSDPPASEACLEAEIISEEFESEEAIAPSPVEQQSPEQASPSKAEVARKGDRSAASKRKRKNAAKDYSTAFEEWWKIYYRFTGLIGMEAGIKSEAFDDWFDLFGRGEPTPEFLEGDAYYQERKQFQFAKEGRAIGVPHACRYLSNSKWKEALDHKRLKETTQTLTPGDAKFLETRQSVADAIAHL